MKTNAFNIIVIHDTKQNHYLAFYNGFRGVFGSGASKEIALSKLSVNFDKFTNYMKSQKESVTEEFAY